MVERRQKKKKRKKKFTIVRFDTDFNFSFLVARKTEMETDIVNNYVRAEISSSENEIEIWNAKSKSKKWW